MRRELKATLIVMLILSFSGLKNAYAVGDNGIYKTTDNGTTWSLQMASS